MATSPPPHHRRYAPTTADAVHGFGLGVTREEKIVDIKRSIFNLHRVEADKILMKFRITVRCGEQRLGSLVSQTKSAVGSDLILFANYRHRPVLALPLTSHHRPVTLSSNKYH